MKKVLIFIAGVVTGAILMLVIAALIGNSSNGESSDLVFTTNYSSIFYKQ